MLYVVGMIIDNVKDNGNTRLVQGLNHLLELADTTKRISGVGTVAALRHIIVHWIVTPVVLRFVQARLVHRAIVITGQDMHGIDTKRLQVVDGPRLCQGKKLPRILGIGTGYREVTVMHLIDNDILSRTTHRGVALPPFRVAVAHIDDNGFLSIDSDSLCKDTRRRHAVDHKLVGFALLVAKGRNRPDTVVIELHVQAVIAKLDVTIGISRREKTEYGLVGRVGHLIEMEGLTTGATGYRQRHHTCNYQFFHTYLAMRLTAKPPPGASLIFSV